MNRAECVMVDGARRPLVSHEAVRISLPGVDAAKRRVNLVFASTRAVSIRIVAPKAPSCHSRPR
jgi:hypothetical protein